MAGTEWAGALAGKKYRCDSSRASSIYKGVAILAEREDASCTVQISPSRSGLVHCHRSTKYRDSASLNAPESLRQAKEKNERTAGFEAARTRSAIYQRPPLSRR